MNQNCSFVSQVGQDCSFDMHNNVYNNLFAEYERVVIQSLITSCGLDMFFERDRHGGDIDTIHNVRQVGTATLMEYKNQDFMLTVAVLNQDIIPSELNEALKQINQDLGISPYSKHQDVDSFMKDRDAVFII